MACGARSHSEDGGLLLRLRIIVLRRSRLALPLLLCAVACSRSPSRPNVLLVTIDTLRPDAVGFVAGRNETPAIDALAAEAFRFPTAVTPTPLTLPAHASLMTGLVPRRHGARDNGQVLPPGAPTLAESIRAAGWMTGAFVSGFPLRALFGLDRGFDHYDDTLPLGTRARLERPADATTAAALAWVTAAREPWFLWVHYYDPHDPYAAHAEFPRPGPQGAYLSEVAFADHALGALRRGVADAAEAPLLTVFTSDHGESFGEHGESTHGFFLYDTTVTVPLVVHFPGRVPAGASRLPARLVDVAPTVLALLGLPAPAGVDGVSLVPAIEGDADTLPPAHLETLHPWLTYGWAPLKALRTADRKLIDAPRAELYDLARDPTESTNLFADRPDEARALGETLARLTPPVGATAGRPDDERVRASLEALGYVSGASGADEAPAGLPDPKDRVAMRRALLKADGLLRRERPRDAIAAFDAILAEEPTNRFAMFRSGIAFARAGAPRAAAERLERAVALDPTNADARFALADALGRSGEREQAIAEWREVIRLQPRRGIAWSNLGTLLAELGRTDEARQALARAVEAEPDNPRLLAGVAQAERTLGQHDAAARHLLEAARVAPAEFKLAATLGALLLEQGRRDEAQAWLERSRPEDADYGEGRLAVARDRSARGDAPGATAALREALAADPVLYGRVAADPGLAPLLRQ
jgi:tetratricopeptide (TPR) repeat protein